MSLNFNADDYVRVPLPNRPDENGESENELHGFIEEPVRSEPLPTDQSTSCWSLKFYQQHFDVDTQQVLRRLAFSLVPNPRTNFVQHVLKPHPDLYGPFWIATTLILAAAIGGNVSSYLQSRGQITSWRYDFRKVTLASTIIYMYWWLVPLGLAAFAYMRSKRAQRSGQGNDDDRDTLLGSSSSRPRESQSLSTPTHKFIDLLSVYGYSLAIYVPVSILWAIPSNVLQWLLVAVAMAVSGAFLVFALFPLFRKEHQKLAGPLLIALVILHCLFSIGLMVTFFHGASSGPSLTNQAPILPVQAQVPVGDAPAPLLNAVGKAKRDIYTVLKAVDQPLN